MRKMRHILIRMAIAIAIVAGVLWLSRPWPDVLAIRFIFDRGAATASGALEKHLPRQIITRNAIPYDGTDKDALLDVYRPARLDPSSPTIVWVHGGGFVSGRRGDIANYLKILAGQGFAVVNVDYTIAPEATYPTPVRQLGRALAFIDSHAATLGINARALILAGDSAGAQIAAQMANIITNPAYAHAIGVTAPVTSQRLRGALLYCGVYDLQTLGTDRGGIIGWFLRTVTWAYSGSRDWSTVPGFERMSVARHVGASFPPAFISAGNADPLGPQSVAMARALQTRQVQVETLFFPKNHKPDLGHEYQFDLDHADGQTALARSVTWLRRHGLQD